MVPAYSMTDLMALLPVILLAIGGMVVLLLEVFQDAHERMHHAIITCLFSALSAAASVVHLTMPGTTPVLRGAGRVFIVADKLSGFLALTVSVALFLTALVSTDFLRRRQAERGEYYALAMFATSGMVLLGQRGKTETQTDKTRRCPS